MTQIIVLVCNEDASYSEFVTQIILLAFGLRRITNAFGKFILVTDEDEIRGGSGKIHEHE